MKRKLVIVATLILICRASCAEFLLADWTPESIATRVGYSAVNLDEGFTKFEILANWPLTSDRTGKTGWYREWLLECTAGALTRSEEFSLVATAGPLVRLRNTTCPLFVSVGIRGTLLGRNRFGDLNFGESLQFTSHIGAGLTVNNRFMIEYRLEHMSNAGLSQSNPGLNLHTIAFSFTFN